MENKACEALTSVHYVLLNRMNLGMNMKLLALAFSSDVVISQFRFLHPSKAPVVLRDQKAQICKHQHKAKNPVSLSVFDVCSLLTH